QGLSVTADEEWIVVARLRRDRRRGLVRIVDDRRDIGGILRRPLFDRDTLLDAAQGIAGGGTEHAQPRAHRTLPLRHQNPIRRLAAPARRWGSRATDSALDGRSASGLPK